MKDGESWNVCKTRLLREYFPLFVKEKIRELVVFNFQEKGRLIREFIKEVIGAAEFLQYNASQADVERVLMNLHPDILA
jgi:delta 1-pyrroline-5-carboxylate dehydrogenase